MSSRELHKTSHRRRFSVKPKAYQKEGSESTRNEAADIKNRKLTPPRVTLAFDNSQRTDVQSVFRFVEMQSDDPQGISKEIPDAQGKPGMIFLVEKTENLGLRRDLFRYMFQVLHGFSFRPRYFTFRVGTYFSPQCTLL